MKLFYTLCIVLFISACHTVVNTKDSTWKAVYKHNQDGQTMAGNIDSLIAGIRAGYDVRVGWGWQGEFGDSILSLEHLATPIFMSIIQQKHVSAIINAHPLLESYKDIQQQRFAKGGHIWQCILSTEGTFNAQVFDRSADSLIRDLPQKHTITWFLDCPAQPEFTSSTPLF